ncbi:DUF4249 domain-containing protein [Reichenbachiella ulvae]|uniref:DUF4249 domain-containing protein n=1 Tax=Reichenbachiella ulvae TaxID=2980104 RepID=A0ABT3CWH5_9BACT|nr:DUF4249 domain-containing protein [Reichenbachiella ulvae]MCV9388062.1 DUF4249 domain-containing protein [Reichenbachiella ulvae]
MKGTLKYIVIFSLILFGCDLERELDIQNVDIERQYFIECYLQPDSLFNLSATEVSPIFEDFILDYSLDFDVFIIEQDTVELLQSLFIEDETGYIYNFGSGRRLRPEANQVDLLVVSPQGDSIRGFTKVPSSIDILEANWTDNQISIQFESSDNPQENYFLYIINYQVENQGERPQEKNELTYLDYSFLEERQTLNAVIDSDSLSLSSEVDVTLMRVTRENFRYQKSLDAAKNASQDNVTFPSPLEGNIMGGLGIFTCFTQDHRLLIRSDNP